MSFSLLLTTKHGRNLIQRIWKEKVTSSKVFTIKLNDLLPHCCFFKYHSHICHRLCVFSKIVKSAFILNYQFLCKTKPLNKFARHFLQNLKIINLNFRSSLTLHSFVNYSSNQVQNKSSQLKKLQFYYFD